MSQMIGWGLCLCAVALAAVVLIRMARRPLMLRLLVIAAIISGAIALQCTIASICSAPAFDTADLAQIVAMSHGYRLYPRPAEGVMSSWTDGPVSGVTFLPASLASSPTSQILIAAAIEALLIFASIIWLHLRTAGPSHRGFALLALLALFWCILGDAGMSRISFLQSASGPMIALMITTITLLTYRPSNLTLALAALCTALACWCKTAAAVWFIVPAAYLALAHGRRIAGKFLLLFVLAFALVSCAVLLKFNARGMWYYMVTLPLAQPWYEMPGQGRGSALLGALLGVIRSAFPALGLFVAAVVIARFLAPQPTQGQSRPIWWRRNSWTILPLTAAVLLPGCIFEYVKVEHDPASMGPVNLFIALTASVALIFAYRGLAPEGCGQPSGERANGGEILAALRQAARPIFTAGLCVFSAWQVAPIEFTPHVLADLQQTIAQTYQNNHEIAYLYLQKHHGEGYFPGDTLATLQASGRLYHSEDGIRLRYLASRGRQRLNPRQITDHLPPQARFVAISDSDQTRDAIKLFPAARKRMSTAELPGFVLYSQ